MDSTPALYMWVTIQIINDILNHFHHVIFADCRVRRNYFRQKQKNHHSLELLR